MTSQDADLLTGLRADLENCGYFPALVEDSILLALGDEPFTDYVVHHEPTFNRDEIRRHLTVLVLTPTRLLIGHTDEQPAEGRVGAVPQAASSTESIDLTSVNAVALTRVVDRPETFRPGAVAAEAWLSVSWGAMRRIDLEPAGCADPSCEADHGLTGTMAPEDLTVRMSVAADGADNVRRLVAFSTALQRVTGRGTVATNVGGR
ncbi:DUF5998 family protein [Mariniluteicoccus endophyticus]